MAVTEVITLTATYQKISTINVTYGEIRTYAKYNSQNVENNQTEYSLKMTYYVPTQLYVAFDSATGTLDGTQKRYTSYTRMNKGETTIQEVTRTMNHDTDGSSFVKEVVTRWVASYGGSGNTSASIVMPKIDRYPVITNAPNFNDEDNPTITYTTTIGFEDATVEAAIFNVGDTTALVPYREVNVANGSYTFNLTTSERSALRNVTPNSNTAQVRFKLRTAVDGGSQYFSTTVKTLTIINANPTFTSSLLETNEKIVDFLGSSASKLILNTSQIETTITPTALKGASITGVNIIYNNIPTSITTSPYKTTISILTTPTINVEVSDSRGNITTGTITWASANVVDYNPIRLNAYTFVRENTTSSNIILNLDANYYQVDFASGIPNVPTVKWKLDSGSETTIPSTNYTIDTTNNKLTIVDYEITNALVYTSEGTFTIIVEDLVTSASNTQLVMRGIPVFDYGEHDFQVNGDLFIADTNRDNEVNVLDAINGIVESGSNTNGSYTKFANGFMICMVNDLSIPHLGSTNFGTATLHYGTTNWTYPVAFTTLINCIAAAQDVGAGVFGAEIDGVASTTAAPITCYGGNVSTYKANVIALGMWK